ncbi:MBOAT family O-acyltransferase [Deinococcus cellulosilyticus]|uniref:Putative alginate O-acetylase AlgI n=1 Tax=Deinococcus cellulosilyticus (strain DSM 18568 / NBRC 106333 / KACC 11606 / 5516J-15) TaxID=1223518 RepID=A0A511N3E7_DEIC1|nr:MBOAT family protein [Deinococcus cellulosilyticus]GEM47007.1 putative alginate O-acetylase AlgI [Deinococcus cellulosilyticus NBRC 106333 = KACC 11606]
MIFSSYIFLCLFLPLFLIIYYLTPTRLKSTLILLASYAFYGWWRWDFLYLLVAITVVSYLFALGIEKARDAKQAKFLVSTGIVLNLLALGYFKYANFGVDSFNALLQAFGTQPLPWTPILLPIGLSFFIFHAISYLVDIYRKEAQPTRNLIDFAAFIALFPHLIAGPVLRYHLLAEQFRSRTHTFEKFSQGSLRFMVGFCKKVLIADSIAPLADASFALQNPTLLDSWLGVLAYTLQIYFDFSGYSDMAIGLALMIGFKFPENFNHPYISRSITEFWRRWHISLSSWLREYLYISLGGNRKGVARTYFNLFLTMVLGGLWHGSNWTFVLWGAWHGGILALERFLGSKKLWKPVPAYLSIPGTLILVMVGWVLFRAHNVGSAFEMYAGMVGLNGLFLSDALGYQVTGLQLITIMLALILIFVGPWWMQRQQSREVGEVMRVGYATLSILPLFVLAALRLAAQDYSPFLYFQF